MRILKPKPVLVRGNQMRLAVSIGARFSDAVMKEVNAMLIDAEHEVKTLFGASNYAGSYGMDDNIGSQARITFASLLKKWERRFSLMAGAAVPRMQDQVKANSAVAVASSLKQFAGEQITIDPKVITAQMREMLTASAAESTALIKSIPSRYLGDLGGSVMRSIVSGNGLEDLMPELARHKVAIRNWAKNTALDQTRKVYTHTNIERLKKSGIRKFEWIHSGGGAHPRKLHEEMSGKVYSMDDPPVIGVMYGKEVRGFPSDLPNCRCVLRPVLDFGD